MKDTFLIGLDEDVRFPRARNPPMRDAVPMMDHDACYRALLSRDRRFDGWFFTGVLTTGIYCRPSCPAVTPKSKNVRFYPSAAAAQLDGFRACKRCRPDVTPGSPEWNVRADVVGRAMRLIADGVVDREGVAGLARRLGYSERQISRQLTAEVGAGPLALARAQRALAARTLLETTDLPITQVAFAAGFASVRQFNDTVRAVFAATPSRLRAAVRNGSNASAPGTISVRLPFRAPMDVRALFGFLALRAVPGVEEGGDGSYRRTLSLPHGPGVVELSHEEAEHGWIRCTLRLQDLRDLGTAVQRSRRLLDLDADPHAVRDVLGRDRVLRAAVRRAPGIRVPGAVDGDEIAVRVLIGQQVSVLGARTIAARLADRYGKPLSMPDGSLTHTFPDAATLAEADPADLPMPSPRKAAIIAMARSLADGSITLDAGADRDETSRALLAIPGIGPWSAAAIRMRALGDPDVFLESDLGVRRALERLGLPADPAGARATSEAWRPWRSYALQYLWNSNANDQREAR